VLLGFETVADEWTEPAVNSERGAVIVAVLEREDAGRVLRWCDVAGTSAGDAVGAPVCGCDDIRGGMRMTQCEDLSLEFYPL